MNALSSDRAQGDPALAATPLGGTSHVVVMEAYDRHQREIYTFLLALTRDVDVAQDLLQETFLRLFTEARQDRVPDNQRAWLYRVASNLAVSRVRRQRTAQRWEQAHAPAEPFGSPEEGYLANERRISLLDYLDQLAPAARSGLLMAAHGFSGAEIAEALGRTPLATRSLLCRSRLRLRELLEKGGESPS